MSGKQIEITTKGRFENIKWIGVLALITLSIVGNIHYASQPLLYRLLGIIALAIIAVFIALTTVKGKAIWELIKEAKAEIRRVVWPTRQETIQTTMVVIVVVLIMGLILWVIDSLLGWAISSFIG